MSIKNQEQKIKELNELEELIPKTSLYRLKLKKGQVPKNVVYADPKLTTRRDKLLKKLFNDKFFMETLPESKQIEIQIYYERFINKP